MTVMSQGRKVGLAGLCNLTPELLRNRAGVGIRRPGPGAELPPAGQTGEFSKFNNHVELWEGQGDEQWAEAEF